MKTKEKAPARPAIYNPLLVIPRRPANVEVKRDSRGNIHLRTTDEPTGFAKKVAGWLRYDNTRKIELDEYGTCYFGMIDGRTNLEKIVEAMVRQFDKPREEIAPMVVLFTKQLMTKSFVELIVPEEACTRDTDEH